MIAFFEETPFKFPFKKNAVNGKLPQIYPKLTDAFSIPIPPIKVQQEVVGVLDKFGALIEDAEGALPAEIAMRKKQYEYYRDALLNFERK